MKPVVTGKEMKKIDAYTIEHIGIPSMVLMERAACGLAERLKAHIGRADPVLCVCGAGNNGGDGVAAARILFCQGYSAGFYMAGNPEKWTEETKKQIQIARNAGVPEYNELDLGHVRVVVDALFGIGLSSPVREPYGEIIRKMNQWRAENRGVQIWSADIPSGVSSDTGRILGDGVCADYTVTFGYLKRGLILYPGREMAGWCFVEDIGFPQKALKENFPSGFTCDVRDFKQLPERKNDSNKGTYGKILIIAGSKNMSGAAGFAGKAAYYTGAGLVRILTEEANRVILQTALPEAMLSVWEETDAETLKGILDWADAIVIGPGIGKSRRMAERMEQVLKMADKPLVIDADGLNLLAEHAAWYAFLPQSAVLTPHMGEMSRLTGTSVDVLKGDRAAFAEIFAEKHHVLCVLKDSSTVISDGRRTCFNRSGNHGMATGGSGDVLAGMIGALMGAGADGFSAACTGVFLHGMAGDSASDACSARGMTASDLVDHLRKVLKLTENRNRGCDKSE